ncbi:VCBS repeat-containing protein [Streptomyces sp. HC44]|uniref:VCBS repeat-containing protein n=1 Tax=Streptomyces scabichelini TaxID=2711217 RepID=A0A6G4V0U8_9ACTN|nr:FG-GAP-like repeat-containing protein [Streptomyces scabichelini]NGO07629.1 VCBS repeat-containing protein [Streptomyces scabichelini]
MSERSRTRSRASSRTAAVTCALLLCAVAGCGTEDGGGTSDKRPSPTPATGDSADAQKPVPAAPVPRGDGGKIRDDVNGDGHPDLAYVTSYGPVGEDGGGTGRNCVVIVYGSDKGLDPATRTVLKPGDAALPEHLGATYPTYPVLADLDADGYADLKFGGNVIWGGPTGPDPKTPSTALPEVTGTPGDFDGDGRLDVPLVEDSRDGLGSPPFRVLYGPIDRNGTPARRGESRPDPVNRTSNGLEYSLHAVDADGDRTTDLVASGGTDGEQGRAVLLTAGDGPAGFAAQPRELRIGNTVTSGDFDGDGKGDVVVGDSGSRNNEPGYETEAPEVDGTLTVYPGDGGAPQLLDPALDLAGDYLAGDTDGDGRDELLIGSTSDGYASEPEITVIPGGPQGLDEEGRRTLRRTGPARVPGAKSKLTEEKRRPHLAAVRDFDQDGRAEVVLHWTLPQRGPSYVWVLEGDKDTVTFGDGHFTGAG